MIGIKQAEPIFSYGLNSSVVRELSTLNPRNFITKSADVIQDAMGIPRRTRPEIRYGMILPQGTPTGYAFCDNEVLMTKEILSSSKPRLFSYLVHEFTHCFQNLQILRTKKLGKEAITTYSILNARSQTQKNIKMLESLSQKALQREIDLNPPETVLKLIKAIKRKNTKETTNAAQGMFNEIYQESTSWLNSIRSVLISEKGAIKDGSERGCVARNFFRSFLISNRTHPDFSKQKYESALTEQLAHHEQEKALVEYTRLERLIQKDLGVCPKSPADQFLS